MKEIIWTLKAMTKAMNATAINIENADINEISIDSRSLGQGAAYFAIMGVSQDGHKFVESAIENGAAVAIVSKEKANGFIEKGLPLLIVDDVLIALEQLGQAARARTKAKIIAITGSAGKTSTKEMLRALFSPLGKTHASVASFNNHWGVPLTLARMHEDTEFGIFEIGMNHSGEITPLVNMVAPHVAAITTVGAAHAGNFNTLEDIAYAKSCLLYTSDAADD